MPELQKIIEDLKALNKIHGVTFVFVLCATLILQLNNGAWEKIREELL